MFRVSPQKLPEPLLKELNRINVEYHYATQTEFEEYVLNVLKAINIPRILRSTDENFQAWEKGWSENLQSISQGEISSKSIKPKYFRPSKFLRFNKKLIVSENLDIEYDLFTLARYLIFTKYLAPYEHIYEFGCGSCQNLLMLSEIFRSKCLYALDWVEPSLEIAKILSKYLNRHITGYKFDMLNPSSDVIIKPKSAVITIHALEQVGTRHEKLLSFILRAKPELVIHYEPIQELYDEKNLLDYLAILYSQKRNYLSGFLTALRELEKKSEIKILQAYRPYLGGVIHESSLIAWCPL